MNTPEGLNRVLEWNQSIEILLDSIDNVNILSQAEILMVMAGLCFLSADAHVYVAFDKTYSDISLPSPSPSFNYLSGLN